MTKKIVIASKDWENKENLFKYCQELERGNILFFPEIPFAFPKKELVATSPQKWQETLQSYADKASAFLEKVLYLYAKEWKKGEVSVQGISKGVWQIDASPHLPTHGARILRLFTNIHPTESKRWITSSPFAELVKKFGGKELPFPSSMRYSLPMRWGRKIKEMLKEAGLKAALRSPYDRFMWRMRRFLKKNQTFQETCVQQTLEFPPFSCWLAFTDQIPHAPLEPSFVVEQPFFVPTSALLYPEHSPVGILERLSGKNLVNPKYWQDVFGFDKI